MFHYLDAGHSKIGYSRHLLAFLSAEGQGKNKERTRERIGGRGRKKFMFDHIDILLFRVARSRRSAKNVNDTRF